jgi:hypothetical protein
MVSHRRSLACSLVLAALAIASQASAQDATTNTVKKEATDIQPPANVWPNGVYWSIHSDLAFNFTDTQKVVGQPDGTTVNFGFKLDAHVDVIQDQHEWRNWLLVNAGLTKTPTIPDFVKNTDSLQLESIYLYHVKPWVGPFARFKLDTSMFAGTDVRPAPVNYKITRQDGTLVQTCDPNSDATCTTTKLPLTDPFQPLTLKESLGAFAQPYKSAPVTVEVRAGLGAQEIFADKQFAVADQPDTPDNCPPRATPRARAPLRASR